MAARLYLVDIFIFSFIHTSHSLLLVSLLLYTNTGEHGGGGVGDQLCCHSVGMRWISIEAARRGTIVHVIRKNDSARDLKANV